MADPKELPRRLARRRLPIMTRPPRAWRLAVRASDRRITEAASRGNDQFLMTNDQRMSNDERAKRQTHNEGLWKWRGSAHCGLVSRFRFHVSRFTFSVSVLRSSA